MNINNIVQCQSFISFVRPEWCHHNNIILFFIVLIIIIYVTAKVLNSVIL